MKECGQGSAQRWRTHRRCTNHMHSSRYSREVGHMDSPSPPRWELILLLRPVVLAATCQLPPPSNVRTRCWVAEASLLSSQRLVSAEAGRWALLGGGQSARRRLRFPSSPVVPARSWRLTRFMCLLCQSCPSPLPREESCQHHDLGVGSGASHTSVGAVAWRTVVLRCGASEGGEHENNQSKLFPKEQQ